MKKSGLLFASLALFCSVGHAESEATFSSKDNILHIPHVSYKGVMYDVFMTYKASGELVLDSATPLETMPSNPVVEVSDKLSFTLVDIDVEGGESFRADISSKDGKFSTKDVKKATHGKMFKGTNITNLGILADKGDSYAYSISEDGKHIVGKAKNSNKKRVPTRFHEDHGHIEELKGLGGGRAEARAVNNNGIMAGFDTLKTESGQPRIYNAYYNESGTDIINIGTLGGVDSRAYGINNDGMIVGWSASKEDNSDHIAFSYDTTNKEMKALGGDILGGKRAFAFGINDSNQITGVATTENGSALAFIYENGKGTSLGSLDSSGYSEGRAINDKGQVTGWSLTEEGIYSAFVADKEGMTAIPNLGGDTKGYAINTHGHVVGGAKDSEGNRFAFLYKDGEFKNLYDLLPEEDKANWKELREGYSISDDGVIVGRGRYWTDKEKEKNSSRAFRIKL